MDFSTITPESYYNTPSLHGRHQYDTLQEIVNNFMLTYVGDDQIIKKINRYKVLFHAKRGLQELSYDILKDVRAIELDINPNTLRAILPQGYIDYVRISQVSADGQFLPLSENRNSVISKNFLQDNQYNIIFDNSGDVLKANINSYDPSVLSDTNTFINNIRDHGCHNYTYCNDAGKGGLYWLDASTANANGMFVIDERDGIISFSTEIRNATIVLEYMSDGFDHASETDIVIHKYAVQALYAYLNWVILDSLEGVQEYVVRRKLRQYKAAYNNSAIRRMNLDVAELTQVLKGRQNWIK